MKYLIVGSSSGLGRALAEALASLGHDLILVAIDENDLRVQSADLSLKYHRTFDYLPLRVSPNGQWLEAFAATLSAVGDLDGALFPMGWSSDDDQVNLAPTLVDELTEVNFSAIVKMISVCLPGLLARNKGTIVGFGSVASLRGRSSNVVYAAAKRALSSYFESLRHAVSGSGLKVQFYQLGYMDTPRNVGKKLLFPMADPAAVARNVVENLDRDFGSVTFPRFWSIVRFVLRWTPWWVYRKLHF
jgi:short-subunit dehydrogenase